MGPRALGALLLWMVSCGSGDPARHDLGGSCVADTDCRVGLVCVGDDPGGQCTRFCTGDTECGAGNLCDPEGKCYRACNQTSDCPRAATDPRYGCVGVALRRFCDVLAAGDGGAG
jgi:hypothetical protein